MVQRYELILYHNIIKYSVKGFVKEILRNAFYTKCFSVQM